MEQIKNLDYWKKNAEEDYMKVPISVLRYITELETELEKPNAEELIKALKDIVNWDDDLEDKWEDQGYRAKAALEKYYKKTNN